MTDSGVQIKPRRVWVVVLFSLLRLGLGQVYNGQFKKATVFWVMELTNAVVISAILLYVNLRPLNVILSVGLFLGLWLVALVDAIIVARRSGRNYHLKRYNRWYGYVGVWIGVSIIMLLYVLSLRNFFVQAFYLGSGSMSPTIQAGERFVVAKAEYVLFNPVTGHLMWRHGHPQRGDVVVFRSPKDTNVIYAKRVVGLPGETLEVRGHRVWIDGAPLNEPYLTAENVAVTYPQYANHGPIRMGPDEYFLMGDCRNASMDSRVFGAVPEESILGRARCIYFSREWIVHGATWREEYEVGPIRWGRIGTVIE